MGEGLIGEIFSLPPSHILLPNMEFIYPHNIPPPNMPSPSKYAVRRMDPENLSMRRAKLNVGEGRHAFIYLFWVVQNDNNI